MRCFKTKYVGYCCVFFVGLSFIHVSLSQNSPEEDVLELYNAEYIEREEILDNIEIQEISNDIDTTTKSNDLSNKKESQGNLKKY